MRYKAVLFDFGYTLVDIAPLERNIHKDYNIPRWRALGFKGTRKDFMCAVAHADMECERCKADAKGDIELWAIVVGRELGVPITKEQARKDFDGFIDYYLRTVKLYPHARQLLRYLKRRGLKLAIISNGWADALAQKLEWLGIRQYFDFVVASESIRARKSDLKPFRMALRKLKLRPADCLMVGDRLDEDAYAKKLGIDFVWFASRPHFKHPRPIEKFDYKIKDLAELKRIVA